MNNTSIPAYSGDAKLWFAQLDCYFTAHGIQAAQQKLHVLISGIPAILADTVKDIITDLPQNMVYDSLRTEILRRNSKSAESRFHALLQGENLGDRTPSEFLRRIRELSDNTPADSFFIKKLVFSCLPTNVQTILANMVDTNTIAQIASSADRIREFSQRPIAADSVIVSSSSRQQPDNENGDTTLKAIDGSTRQIAQFCRVRRRSRSRSFFSKRRNTFSTHNSSVCWYHAHFHDKARHCNTPCAFKVSEN
ncbi:uncharacterized protein LOC106871348 [Octopus bimaculoides]|uniref:uncharacterized protein LOC106871348 n=1 Tax=Octopus bimaculoides TaxID=37653 RepID=UPI00071DE141|nr:uncharacterized protein LOC106871348 [Octopus bimaculoides]|eukprot:XP_014773237.1 PREDICTED: uncharacterized protein LOC106871348 [Octopus bimaculoides]